MLRLFVRCFLDPTLILAGFVLTTSQSLVRPVVLAHSNERRLFSTSHRMQVGKASGPPEMFCQGNRKGKSKIWSAAAASKHYRRV